MGLNNSATTLIVWGSYAPGGANHGRFSDLAGTWRKGFVMAERFGPDDIGPAKKEQIEAWLLDMKTPEFDDPYGPESQAWKRELFDFWAGLDAAMGPGWGRSQQRWWPEGSNAVVGTAGMRVANIYLPLARYPYLANQYDLPHPDDADDLPKLWHQVRRGEKRYEWSDFIALIKDCRADELDALFGDLPNSAEFLGRLKRFFADHELKDGSILWPGGDRIFYYAYSLQRNARPLPELVALAKQDLAQRAGFLDRIGEGQAAQTLRGVSFVTGKLDDPDFGDAHEALEIMGDGLWDQPGKRPFWSYVLNEACYSITTYFPIRDWLMLPFTGIPITPPSRPSLATRLGLRPADPGFDLEPAYQLWKGGGEYAFDGTRCHVWEINRRDASASPAINAPPASFRPPGSRRA